MMLLNKSYISKSTLMLVLTVALALWVNGAIQRYSHYLYIIVFTSLSMPLLYIASVRIRSLGNSVMAGILIGYIISLFSNLVLEFILYEHSVNLLQSFGEMKTSMFVTGLLFYPFILLGWLYGGLTILLFRFLKINKG